MTLRRPFPDRFNNALDEARACFWMHIAKTFPEAIHGDLSPRDLYVFQVATEQAAKAWIEANCPQVQYPLGTYVRYSSACGQVKAALACVVQNGVECIDPESCAALAYAGVSPCCAWGAIDEVRAVPPLTDTEMLDLMMNGHTLHRDYRLILEHRSQQGDAMAQALIRTHWKMHQEF